MKASFDKIGDVIAAIGSDRFPQALSRAIQLVSQFDYCVIFGYYGTAQPLDLYDTFPASKRQIFVENYQAGPYLLDPFYLACTTRLASGLYRLKDIAPDRFLQGEYFRNYYVQTGLAEEIGYFVNLDDGVSVVISLMRTNKVFSAKDFRDLNQFLPVVKSSIEKNWPDLSARFEGKADANNPGNGSLRLERAFLKFGEDILTPREREVVEYTLKGHSADAIGRILDIAAGTVRIHRRNIYSKLRISSQGELFSMFINTLAIDGRAVGN